MLLKTSYRFFNIVSTMFIQVCHRFTNVWIVREKKSSGIFLVYLIVFTEFFPPSVSLGVSSHLIITRCEVG